MWEEIDSYTDRLKVPDGWIVRSIIDNAGVNDSGGAAIHQIFLSDPDHEWKLEQSPKS